MSDVDPTREQPQVLLPPEQKATPRNKLSRTSAALLLIASAHGLGSSVTTREEPLPPTYSTVRTVHDTHVKDIIPERYAKDFSADPEAGKLVHPADVERTVDQYEALLAQGYTLSDISVQGNASDEDNTLNKEGEMTGGLGVKNEENVALALKRSTVFEALLKKEFEARGLQVPKIDIVMPEEDVLHSKQIGSLIRLAQEGGFTSILEMIEKYNNNDGSLPKGSSNIIDQLNRALGEERNVTVTYSGTDTTGKVIEHDRKERVPVLWTVPINVLNAPLNNEKGPEESLGNQPKSKLENQYGRSQNSHNLKRKQPRVFNEGNAQMLDHAVSRDRGGSMQERGAHVPARSFTRRGGPIRRSTRRG